MKSESTYHNTFVSLRELKNLEELLLEKVKRLIETTKSNGNILRVEQEIPNIDPISWLQQQTNPLKIYWSDRDREFEIAGIGYADLIANNKEIDFDLTFKRMRRNLNPQFKNLRYYGGFCFGNTKQNDIWQNFGAGSFIIPQVELFRENNQTKVALNLTSSQVKDFSFDFLDNGKFYTNFEFSGRNIIQKRFDFPPKDVWIQNMKFVKKLFRGGKIEKIVLARKSRLEFLQKLIPEQLLLQLGKTLPKSFHFYFQPEQNLAFLSASPELLYRRQNSKIFSEAVAGTRPRGLTKEDDEKLANDLLQSDKDIHEHNLVCRSITSGMNQICNSIEMDNHVSIIKCENVQHLYKKFKGILKEDIGDAYIISKLHPTPAVGGIPKDIALQEIREIENFDRGWYAGPVGWVGSNCAQFAVGIRSGLISGNDLYLFSGAGIVPDSDPEQEWQEIEHKISHFTKVFKQ
jgi:menaquinone-specific isochorismate synthase